MEEHRGDEPPPLAVRRARPEVPAPRDETLGIAERRAAHNDEGKSDDVDSHQPNRHERQRRACAKRVEKGLRFLPVQVDLLLQLQKEGQGYAPQAQALLCRREVPRGASEHEQNNCPHVSRAGSDSRDVPGRNREFALKSADFQLHPPLRDYRSRTLPPVLSPAAGPAEFTARCSCRYVTRKPLQRRRGGGEERRGTRMLVVLFRAACAPAGGRR